MIVMTWRDRGIKSQQEVKVAYRTFGILLEKKSPVFMNDINSC